MKHVRLFLLSILIVASSQLHAQNTPVDNQTLRNIVAFLKSDTVIVGYSSNDTITIEYSDTLNNIHSKMLNYANDKFLPGHEQAIKGNGGFRTRYLTLEFNTFGDGNIMFSFDDYLGATIGFFTMIDNTNFKHRMHYYFVGE